MGSSSSATAPLRALEAIYRDHHRRVRWILRARGIPESALDDLVHDVFLAVHRRLPDRDSTVPISMWIAGVTHNIAFSHRRSWARRERDRQGAPEPSSPPGPEEALADHEAWQLLRGFVDELPVEQREVFVLVDMLGESMTGVARMSDTRINTLYSRLRLARRKFEARFGSGAVATTMLQRGPDAEPIRPERIARGWALLVLQLEAPVVAAATSGAAFSVAKIIVAAGVSIVALSQMPDRSPPASLHAGLAVATVIDAADAGTEPRRPLLPKSIATATLEITPPTVPEPSSPASPRAAMHGPPEPIPAPVVEPAPPSTDTRPEDPLAVEVAALRRARAALLAGRPRDALARLAVHAPRPGDDAFARERLVIELEAVCALRQRERAVATARRLLGLGVSIDPARPCRED